MKKIPFDPVEIEGSTSETVFITFGIVIIGLVIGIVVAEVIGIDVEAIGSWIYQLIN